MKAAAKLILPMVAKAMAAKCQEQGAVARVAVMEISSEKAEAVKMEQKAVTMVLKMFLVMPLAMANSLVVPV